MLTESEAKSKVCHRTLGIMREPVTGALEPVWSCCWGSACMAWEWAPGETDRVERQKRSQAEIVPMRGDCGLKHPVPAGLRMWP
jgi:hypothetical protein